MTNHRVELDEIEALIQKLEARRRAIYAESLSAAEADKVCEDWVAEMLSEPERRLRFPVTVTGIAGNDGERAATHRRRATGKWAAVRPCGKEHGGKTLLGIYIGDVATAPSARFVPETGMLHLGFSGYNPAIWVPSLNKLVYGYESWWGVIKSPQDLKQISDEDISSIWYVRALQELTSGGAAPATAGSEGSP